MKVVKLYMLLSAAYCAGVVPSDDDTNRPAAKLPTNPSSRPCFLPSCTFWYPIKILKI